jgi:hypothetical protein
MMVVAAVDVVEGGREVVVDADKVVVVITTAAAVVEVGALGANVLDVAGLEEAALLEPPSTTTIFAC